ncbi:MAG TPA: NAD(P)-dependent oxidoreductase [Terriglobia bacterium]
MKVLVTGAFGCIGSGLVGELQRRGHRIRTFDLPTIWNRKAARRWRFAELVWGDIRDSGALQAAVQDQDAIIHLAGVLPPDSDSDPVLAKEVNVAGTANVLSAAKAAAGRPRIIYTSSFHIYGPTAHLPPPRRVDDPVMAVDAYTAHKLECEDMLKRSGLDWTIIRLAYVPHIAWRRPPALLFEVPLDTRVETLHVRDAAAALANALDCDDALGRILLVGGGPRCQVLYRDYIFKALWVMGIDPLPEAAFGKRPYPMDWLDTVESERLLRYQRHSFHDIILDTQRQIGVRRGLARLLHPLPRYAILRLSPYWPPRLTASL